MNPNQQDMTRLANTYRRNFTWRLSEGGLKQEVQVAGAVRLSTSEYPDILEDLLYISRKRQKNATAMAQLQLNLLHDLAVQEQSIKSYKAKVAPDSNAQQLIESQIFTHRLISNTIRNIGDGIVWRSLGYDRSIPRILSAHPDKRTVLDEGLASELHEWSTIHHQASRTAIINAITNCIGIGDITAIDADGSVELIEVKSAKTKSSRKIRQRNRLKDAAGILTTGVGLIEGKQVRVTLIKFRRRSLNG